MFKHDAFLGKVEKQADTPDPLCNTSVVEKSGFAGSDPFLRDHGFETVEKCGECSACKGLKKGSGDFTDCMTRIVPAAKPDDPEAFCADYEHRQTGHWPGEKRASESLQKVWSDEARAAAAEARENNARARSRDEGGPPDVLPEKPKGRRPPPVGSPGRRDWAQSATIRPGS